MAPTSSASKPALAVPALDDSGDKELQLGGGESKQQSRKKRAAQAEAELNAGAEKDVPRPRFKAASCVSGRKMYVYGGMWEEKGVPSRTGCTDDLWSIDLNKLEQWELHTYYGRGADCDAVEELESTKSGRDKKKSRQRGKEGGESKSTLRSFG